MVALLWKEGNSAAAIRLEQHWNNLSRSHAFCLFCAYPMNGFQGAANGEPFVHICHEHSRVIPAESYGARTDPQERLRAITLLQQQASSLDAEIAVRKHAESTTDAERAKLSMAVTMAGLGIWELDLVSNAFVCSEQSKVHAGFSPHEFMTRERFFELVHPDDRAPVQEALRAAMAGKGQFNVEYRVIDRNKEERWVAAMGRCFHNGSHRLLGVTLDITERKRAAEILERTVAERTVELHATINELEAFSYSISHDMRAPLRSMRGFADILLKECSDKLNPECRGYLERICSAGGRMDRLIQDVLTFSRVAKTELTLEPINLDHLVHGIVECYPDLQRAEVLIEGTDAVPFQFVRQRCQVCRARHAAHCSCLVRIRIHGCACGTRCRAARFRGDWLSRGSPLHSGQRHRYSERSAGQNFRHLPTAGQRLRRHGDRTGHCQESR
jgi:PAS domain S-box-containing protein